MVQPTTPTTKTPTDSREGPFLGILQKIEKLYENKMVSLNNETEDIKEIIMSFKEILFTK
jgi:hypothetical protein